MANESSSAHGLFATHWMTTASAAMQLFAGITLGNFVLDAKLFLYLANVGAFVTGLGLGTLFESRVKRTTKKEMERSWALLSLLQLRASLSATVGIPILATLIIAMDHWRRTQYTLPYLGEAIAAGILIALLSLWLGINAGRQLPIISAILKKRNADAESFRYLFGLDYLGCALGGISYLLIFYPLFGWVHALAIAALFSAAGNVATLLFLGIAPKKHLSYSLGIVSIAVVALVYGNHIENFMDNLLFGF